MERDDLKRLEILIVNFWVEEYIVLEKHIRKCTLSGYILEYY